MSRWAWTINEIQRLPKFGNDHGWFYGIVQDKGFHLSEIVPGYGYTSARWGWRLPNPLTVVKDIWHYQPGVNTQPEEGHPNGTDV